IVDLEIDLFGKYEGVTVHQSGTVCGVRFLFGEAERQNLAAKLTAFVTDGIAGVERGVLSGWSRQLRLPLVRPNGFREQCDVLDISLQGVLLGNCSRLPIGELVNLGSMYGRVATHIEEGIGIQFVTF